MCIYTHQFRGKPPVSNEDFFFSRYERLRNGVEIIFAVNIPFNVDIFSRCSKRAVWIVFSKLVTVDPLAINQIRGGINCKSSSITHSVNYFHFVRIDRENSLKEEL